MCVYIYIFIAMPFQC